MMKYLTLIALTAILSSQIAIAQTPVLRAEATVGGDVVRLGDLVENAGALGTTPLFRSPAPGRSGTIRSDRILLAIQELGGEGLDTRGQLLVTVRRPTREASSAELAASIRQALARVEPTLAEATLKLDSLAKPLTLDLIGQAELQVELSGSGIQMDRFEAIVRAGPETPPVRVSGQIDQRIQVAVLTRNIPRGEPIQATDLRSESRKSHEISTGSMIEPSQLSGLVARRALRAGQTIRDQDVVRPEIVEKNQMVTIHLESGGMQLALRGKALAGGIEGAIVPVQNLQSKRSIEAVIVGPGRVALRKEQPHAR